VNAPWLLLPGMPLGLPCTPQHFAALQMAMPEPQSAGVAHSRSKVVTCAALSRLAASRGFEKVLKGHARDLHAAIYNVEGRAALTRWEMQVDDVLELREELLDDAGRYHDLDSFSESDGEEL
jgi:hypothetical protein